MTPSRSGPGRDAPEPAVRHRQAGHPQAGRGLQAVVHATRGTLTLAAELDVADGEVVALVGPNGAGKSTLLRALAGLMPLASGRVVLGGTVLDDPGLGVHVVPERRGVGVLFQDHRLFPHLSVLDNVAFPARVGGARAGAARRTARHWLDRVGVPHLARARPGQLSGGQQQRVALARTLASAPRLLLLDEPLAAVDPAARAQLVPLLREHLTGFGGPALVVTHQHDEAARLADRVLHAEAGRVR